MKQYTNDYTIGSVDRALKILMLFSPAHEHMTLMEIASMTGLHKSTVMRMLYTLQVNGFVKYDEARRSYSLGLSVFKLGNYARCEMDLRRIAKPHLIRLSQSTELIVHLGILEQASILIIDKVYPSNDIIWPAFRSDVGGTMPAYCTGIGRLFLAYLQPAERDALFEQIRLVQYTPNTMVDRDAIEQRLGQLRERNVEHCDCEHEQYIYSIAAPIFDYHGHMVAGVSAGGFKEAFADPARSAAIERLVRQTGQRISSDLGYEGAY